MIMKYLPPGMILTKTKKTFLYCQLILLEINVKENEKEAFFLWGGGFDNIVVPTLPVLTLVSLNALTHCHLLIIFCNSHI